MTVEQLHDAIGLLPADLLAETDQLRTAPRPRKTVLWKPLLAMAACLTLVLAGWFWWFQPKGSARGTADTASLQAAPAAGAVENGAAEEAEMAQPAEDAAPFRSQSAVTEGTSLPEAVLTPRLEGETQEPAAVLLTCPADWTDYRTQMGEQFDLTELEPWAAFLDEDWFAGQDLVLIRIENVPEGEAPQGEILRQEEGILEIGLPQYPGAEDGTCWHILLPVEKGTLETSGQISLIFE